MGTINARKRKDGSTAYTAQILRKKGGAIVWREAKTFDREREAKAWIRFRESELDRPGGLDKVTAKTSTLADAIDRYNNEKSEIGRTKAQVLETIKDFAIAGMDCSSIRSGDIVAFAQELLSGGRKPQTVGNYISHLAAIFRIAKPAWGMQLDQSAMRDAQVVLRDLGTTSKSDKRDSARRWPSSTSSWSSLSKGRQGATVCADAQNHRIRDILNSSAGGDHAYCLGGSRQSSRARPRPRHEASRTEKGK